MTNLVLASSSAPRKALLERLQLRFEVVVSHVDETPLPNELPIEIAHRLAISKAKAVAKLRPQAVIIGGDQVAVCEGNIMDKPITHDNATRQLKFMRGKSATFHSALCVYQAATDTIQSAVVSTHVAFRPLSDSQIEAYLRHEPAYNCAGSAKVEGLGIMLMASIQSNDPTALIGLPLIALIDMLHNIGVDVPCPTAPSI